MRIALNVFRRLLVFEKITNFSYCKTSFILVCLGNKRITTKINNIVLGFYKVVS